MRATPRRRRCFNLSHGNPPRVSTCAPDCRVLQPLRAAACFNLSTPLHHRPRRRRRSAPPPLTSSSTSTAAAAPGQDRPSEAHGTQKMGPCLKAREAAPRTREEHDSDPTESSRGAKPSPRQTHRLRRVGPSRPHRGQPPGPPRRAASARVEESPSYTHTHMAPSHTQLRSGHSSAHGPQPHVVACSLFATQARARANARARIPRRPPLSRQKAKRPLPVTAPSACRGWPHEASRPAGMEEAGRLLLSWPLVRSSWLYEPRAISRVPFPPSCISHMPPPAFTPDLSHVPSHLPPSHLTSRRPGRRRARALPDGRRCGGVAPLRRAALPREAGGAAWPNVAAGLGWGHSTASRHG